MIALLWEWLNFAARWTHVITAIAWIGSSFYFIALDLGLKRREGLPAGAHGEDWQVHGGGFYHMQKYLVAPAQMPEHLTWFKWESYATWLSGFFLLCVLYYGSAELFLIDRSVADIAPWQAVAIGIAGLVAGWVVYDLLCKSPLGSNDYALYAVLFAFVVAMAWGFTQVFSGRGAFLHLGAFTATIMSANVFMIIIPNQKIVVASLLKGESPDPKFGKIAKQRSMHNNYLTLPVLFLMLSNHYPLAFGTQFNWIIIALVFLMGVTIRHFFNIAPCRQGLCLVDLGRDGDPVHPRHVAVAGGAPAARPARSDGAFIAGIGATATRRACRFSCGARHRRTAAAPCATPPSRCGRALPTRPRACSSTMTPKSPAMPR